MLFQNELLLQSFLMAIASIEQLASLLCSDIRQFLRSLLLVRQSLYSVFQGLILCDLVFEDLLLLSLLDTGEDLGVDFCGMAAPTELIKASSTRPEGTIVKRRAH